VDEKTKCFKDEGKRILPLKDLPYEKKKKRKKKRKRKKNLDI
jgi:hypothetical protein